MDMKFLKRKDTNYLVNIFYRPLSATGQILKNINGTTHSMMSYGGGYFIASSPGLRTSATGSSYNEALSNILIVMEESNILIPGSTDGTGDDSEPFKITVDTTKPGSADDTITLPLDGSLTYDFDIDWGDENTETITSNADITHIYSSPGVYQISIKRIFPRIVFGDGVDKEKLISIDNWGDIIWSSMQDSFRGCKNMNGMYSDAPNLNNVISLRHMFAYCNSFNPENPCLNCDTSHIENMGYMFYSCNSFKQDISGLSIESVTDVSGMLGYTDINETGTTTNYDNLLISFENQAGLYNKTALGFNGGNAQYSSTGETARNNLTKAVVDGGYGWVITDGGLIT